MTRKNSTSWKATLTIAARSSSSTVSAEFLDRVNSAASSSSSWGSNSSSAAPSSKTSAPATRPRSISGSPGPLALLVGQDRLGVVVVVHDLELGVGRRIEDRGSARARPGRGPRARSRRASSGRPRTGSGRSRPSRPVPRPRRTRGAGTGVARGAFAPRSAWRARRAGRTRASRPAGTSGSRRRAGSGRPRRGRPGRWRRGRPGGQGPFGLEPLAVEDVPVGHERLFRFLDADVDGDAGLALAELADQLEHLPLGHRAVGLDDRPSRFPCATPLETSAPAAS